MSAQIHLAELWNFDAAGAGTPHLAHIDGESLFIHVPDTSAQFLDGDEWDFVEGGAVAFLDAT